MFGKRNNNTDTPQDIKVQFLSNEASEAQCNLIEQTERVIICNGVIDLYPESNEKIKAKKDLESEKEKLLSLAKAYDDAITLYRKALFELAERNTTRHYSCGRRTSQQIIESTYQNFFKRR